MLADARELPIFSYRSVWPRLLLSSLAQESPDSWADPKSRSTLEFYKYTIGALEFRMGGFYFWGLPLVGEVNLLIAP